MSFCLRRAGGIVSCLPEDPRDPAKRAFEGKVAHDTGHAGKMNQRQERERQLQARATVRGRGQIGHPQGQAPGSFEGCSSID